MNRRSWVTTTRVRFPRAGGRAGAGRSRRRGSVELAGRLVGEDQTGSLIRARAIATRCCSPPDICYGRWSSRSPRPTSLSSSAAFARRSGVTPSGMKGSSTFSTRREVADQVERLEDEPDLVAAVVVLLGLGHRGEVPAVDADRPRVGRSSAAEQVEQRALARARRPDDERARPRAAPGTSPRAGPRPSRPRSGTTSRTSTTSIIRQRSAGRVGRRGVGGSGHVTLCRIASIGVSRDARQAG